METAPEKEMRNKKLAFVQAWPNAGNKFLVLFIAALIILPLASASADIAYILKNSGSPNTAFTSAMTEAGYTYDLIDDSKITSTNFSKYGMILVDDGNFGNLAASIPVNKMSSLIANTYHMDDWNWVTSGTASIGSSQPLHADVINMGSLITQGVPANFQAYTQAKGGNGQTIPMYYLSKSRKAINLIGEVSTEADAQDFVIATADVGTHLKNNNISQAKGVFFGITETQYWTQDSKTLFKNSIKWLIGDQDQDSDGYPAKNDCNDHDASINPGAHEIPYDSIDQDCKNSDLADVDLDGYCKAGYTIINKQLQCPLENGSVGTDCNDNDRNTHPGATDEKRDCINKAPIFNGNLTNIEWNEDSLKVVNFGLYFSDADADLLNYTIDQTSDNNDVTLEISPNGFIRFASSPNWNGKDWVVIKATDPSGLSAYSGNITLTVNPVNDAPVLEHIGDALGVEGSAITITANASDVDGDNLEFSGNNANFVQNVSVFTWQTQVGNAGDYSLKITVDDGHGGTASQTVNIGVFKKVVINEFVSDPNSGNEWVEIYNPGTQAFSLASCILEDGSNHQLQLEGSVQGKKFSVFELSSNTLNNDGDAISLFCYGQLIDKVVYGNWNDANKGTDNNAPAPGKGKSTGRDPDGKDTDNDKNDFKVFDIPTKGMSSDADLIPPTVELLSPANGAVFNDTRDVTFEFQASDNSAQQLTCYLKLDGETVSSNSFANGTSSHFSINGIEDGNYVWNVICYDNSSGGSSANRTFTISAPNIPTIAIISDKNINEGQSLEFIVQGSDQDSNNLSLRAENLPAGAGFTDRHDKTGLFSWQPSFDQSGNYTVRFVIRDESGLESSREVKINVNDIIAPPTFSDAKVCKIKDSNINIDIRDPNNNDDFKIGDKIKGEVKVRNEFGEDLSFDLTAHLYDLKDDSSVDDDSDSQDINSKDSESFKFNLNVPDDTENKDFAFYVYAEDENGRCNSDYVKIKIKREKDKVLIDRITSDPQIVAPGDNAYFNVDLKNIGDNDEDAYVVLENKELGISEKSDQFTIEKYSKHNEEKIPFTVNIPKTAAEKEYEFTATLYYSGEEESNTTSVLVTNRAIEKIPASNIPAGGLIALGNNNSEKPTISSGKTIYREGESSGNAQKGQVNLNVSGFKRNDLLTIIDVILAIGILIIIVMIRIVTSRR